MDAAIRELVESAATTDRNASPLGLSSFASVDGGFDRVRVREKGARRLSDLFQGACRLSLGLDMEESESTVPAGLSPIGRRALSGRGC